MTDSYPEYEPSPAEREASLTLLKLEAETKRVELQKLEIETEAKKIDLEKLQAVADKAKIEVALAEMSFEKTKKRHNIEMAADREHCLYRFRDRVTSSSISKCMQKLTQWSRLKPGCDMEIIFSSPGGGIIDGFELFDFIQDLRNNDHHITTGTLGYAASMAGVLLQAGDTRWIGHQAWMMIHRAAFGAFGKTFEIEDEVKFIKRIEDRIIKIFTSRSSLTSRKLKRNWDRKDWWISAEDALELGLVDEVRAVMPEHSSDVGKKS
jgi:ATP-dependent Clp endopeptidase proteolytic subunit ClpP